MHDSANLWAVAFDDLARAEQARATIADLAVQGSLKLLDTAVSVRHPDGTITLDGERMTAVPSLHESPIVRFLTGLILSAPPLTGRAAGQMLHTAGMRCPTQAGIDEDFVHEVARVMKPGTSVLFVLDQAGNLDAILDGIRGLGGSILKTNVDLQRATLIQAALAGG
jgi:uncharacterized membrane protein